MKERILSAFSSEHQHHFVVGIQHCSLACKEKQDLVLYVKADVACSDATVQARVADMVNNLSVAAQSDVQSVGPLEGLDIEVFAGPSVVALAV